MFYRLVEETHEVNPSRPHAIHTLCSETYGVCTCGEKFLLERQEPHPVQGWLQTVHREKHDHCPKCGDPLGTDWQIRTRFEVGKGKVYEEDSSTLTLSAFIEKPDGGLTIIKEAVPKKTKACPAPKFIRYEVTVGNIPTPHVENIQIDGQPVKTTKTNINKALGNVSYPKICRVDELNGLTEELQWISNGINSQSLPKALNLLLDYPVLDTVFQKPANRHVDTIYKLVQSIKDGEIKKGERSERKAFGLPKVVCDAFWGNISLANAKWAVEEFGPELTVTAIQDMKKLRLTDFNFKKFANTYCRLRTAERQRVMEYLTHDVDIYQGIEEPKAAVEILLDYRRMCEDMEIAPELCPKSLKLQHDMAAKNYKLCLDDIQKRKFLEAAEDTNYKRLAWTSKDGAWTILVPKKAEDIVEEGRKQSHCVGSYVGYVINREYRICFLRRTEDLEKPVLTLTVNQKDCCIYYKGFDNRDAMTEEKDALKEWAKEKKLSLSANG